MSMTDTETKLVEKLKDWYIAAADTTSNRDWRERAAKGLRFYNGSGQWDETLKRLLVSQGRPTLTINRILSTVNVVWGHAVQNRTEIRLEPLRRGTKQIAELGSALLKHTMDTGRGYDSSSDAFRDGLITGKGWITTDHVRDRDPVTGELIVEAPNPLFLYEDPRNTDYEIDKGEYVFRERFWTQNKLKAYFPNKFAEAMAAMGADWFQPISGESGNSLAGLVEYLNIATGHRTSLGSPGDASLNGVVVRECWWKEYEAVKMATLSINGQTVSGRVRGREDEQRLEEVQKTRPDIQVSRTKSVIVTLKLAVMVGDLLLRRENDPLNGVKNFPYIRYSPYWLHGDCFGVVDNLIGPQEELNLSRSNLLHDANINGNPAWKAAKANAIGRRQIQEYGSTPGVLLEENDFGGKIERIEPGQLSTAHAQLSEQNAADIQEISGANPNLMGTPTESVESGRARLIQQEAGLKVLAPVMSNYYRSQALLGETIWEIIRRNGIYSPEEIEAVVDQDIILSLGGMQGVVEAMNRWDAGTYAVKAIPSKTTSTWRDVQLEEVKALADMVGSLGLAMPPDVANNLLVEVLELSSFPGAAKIAERLKQMPAAPAMQELPGGTNPKQGTRTGAVAAAAGGAPG